MFLFSIGMIVVVFVISFVLTLAGYNAKNGNSKEIEIVIGFLLALSYVSYYVWLLFRFYFAQPLLWIDENLTSKEALEKSFLLSKNSVGRIFLNLVPFLLVSLLIYFASHTISAYFFHTTALFKVHTWTMSDILANFVADLIRLPFVVFYTPLAQSFNYVFTKNMLQVENTHSSTLNK